LRFLRKQDPSDDVTCQELISKHKSVLKTIITSNSSEDAGDAGPRREW
jgi:hypothetical protein